MANHQSTPVWLAFDEAEDGQERADGLSRNNLQCTIAAIIKRAGIDPIDSPYQSLRQSCENEWALTYPQHTVSAWLGHSTAVSLKHYLR